MEPNETRYHMAMLLIAAIAAVVVLAGCGLEVAPEPYNTPVSAPADLDRAQGVVRAEWSARLGFDLPKPPVVTYYTGCLVYPDAYMKPEWRGGCIHGRYWGADATVDVQVQRGGVTEDALAHEMLHWALHMATGDSNSEHDDPLWAELPDVQETLAVDALCRAKYDTATCDGLR